MRSAVLLIAAILVAAPAAAQEVENQIQAALQSYRNGNLAEAAGLLQTALEEVQIRLSETLLPLLPAAPQGWQAFDAEAEALGLAGAGVVVSRGYEMGEATMNAAIILDEAAAGAVAVLLANPAAIEAQPGMRKVEVGGDPALLRFDQAEKAGEIMLPLGDRLLLQAIGTDIDSADPLIAVMRGWDVAAVRGAVGP